MRSCYYVPLKACVCVCEFRGAMGPDCRLHLVLQLAITLELGEHMKTHETKPHTRQIKKFSGLVDLAGHVVP